MYLGVSIKGDVDANLAPSPPVLMLKAAVRQLSLEQLFKRLDKAPAASGPLDLDLAVKVNGTDLHALLASMSGQVSGSIKRGSLAERTINLAGQTIIEWMFTRSADGSAPLVCFVIRFDFKDGIGTARQLVLETDKVQVPGGGTLNLRKETMGFVNGRPTIRGLRITVETVLGFLSAGESPADILEQYPSLEAEDIDAIQRGLTATPTDYIDHNTFELFDCRDGLPSYYYSYEQAIADDNLVNYRALDAQTNFQLQGVQGDSLPEPLRQLARHHEGDHGI